MFTMKKKFKKFKMQFSLIETEVWEGSKLFLRFIFQLDY